MTYKIAVVGTGDPTRPDGFAMAYRHARGYERLDDCELVACADVAVDNAEAFAGTFCIDDGHVYEDHERMLQEAEPDVVSVCTPTSTHASIVTDCAGRRGVEAVHCEKPMAATWAECREMVAVCDREAVQLTFNHQRRFAAPYREAKAMLDAGEIGELERIELGGADLYDYGTHLFDMCGYMTDQTPVEWVTADVDRGDVTVSYGLPRERRALARWHYESGVEGLASTGTDRLVRCELRLVGDEGVIEIGHEDGPPLRFRAGEAGWSAVETGNDGVWRSQPGPLRHVDGVIRRVPFGPTRLFTDPSYVDRAIEDVVQALRAGRRSELDAANALQTTEVIFACWESARQGGRVDLPLHIEDNPLMAMVEETPVDQNEPVASSSNS